MENVIIPWQHIKFRMGKYTSFLSAGKFHDEDSIISSTDKFHGKIPSFSSRSQNFHKDKKTSFLFIQVMITIILNFIYVFTWALHCCALLVTINQSVDEKN